MVRNETMTEKAIKLSIARMDRVIKSAKKVIAYENKVIKDAEKEIQHLQKQCSHSDMNQELDPIGGYTVNTCRICGFEGVG